MDFLTRFNTGGKTFLRPERDYKIDQAGKSYTRKHSGVCLVVGTHPCWNDDLEAALKKYPDAAICGVNYAAGLFPVDFLATCHGEMVDKFMAVYQESWACEPPELHVMWQDPPKPMGYDAYLWKAQLGAGSAPFAASIMALIGFDLIIFCGCPIDGSGGYAYEAGPSTVDDPKIGKLAHDHEMVKAWHYAMVQMKEKRPDICGKFRSMSGFTKNTFGGIE